MTRISSRSTAEALRSASTLRVIRLREKKHHACGGESGGRRAEVRAGGGRRAKTSAVVALVAAAEIMDVWFVSVG